MFKIGDTVEFNPAPSRPGDFFYGPENVQAELDFLVNNGTEWLVMGRATGWLSEQPWQIKSLRSGLVTERFAAELRLLKS